MAEMKHSSSIPTIATIETKNHEESKERVAANAAVQHRKKQTATTKENNAPRR
jgi:hypothetical protein